MRAAVPQYLVHQFEDAPPGHRFGLYFSGWDDQWGRPDNSLSGFKKVLKMPQSALQLTTGLCQRQLQLAMGVGALTISAKSIAPFSTGLGNEHPTENGFAFLNPYGIPYLPGSGVKGVMRSAAVELQHGFDGVHPGWTEEVIDQLFGKGGDDEGNSGALIFWDVIPELNGRQMGVEIMNPHYGDYYQRKGTPNDASNPVPIFFLTVPPESSFTFHVQPHRGRLQDDLPENWQEMIGGLFEYAFDWVGFGAKTSVGYGAMAVDQEAVLALRKEQEEMKLQEQRRQEKKKRLGELSPVERLVEEILEQRQDKNMPEHTFLIQQLEQGEIDQEMVVPVAEVVKQKMAGLKKWREQSGKKNPNKDKEHQMTLRVMRFLGH